MGLRGLRAHAHRRKASRAISVGRHAMLRAPHLSRNSAAARDTLHAQRKSNTASHEQHGEHLHMRPLSRAQTHMQASRQASTPASLQANKQAGTQASRRVNSVGHAPAQERTQQRAHTLHAHPEQGRAGVCAGPGPTPNHTLRRAPPPIWPSYLRGAASSRCTMRQGMGRLTSPKHSWQNSSSVYAQ